MNTPIAPGLDLNLNIHQLRTVYGCLMNHPAEHAALGAALHAKPYGAPPRAPVLYIKPSSTFSKPGAALAWPVPHMQVRACVGLFIEEKGLLPGIKSNDLAIDLIANVFGDFTRPQLDYFRPPVKFNALDGSLGLPAKWQRISAQALLQERIETWINGRCVHRYAVGELLRSPLQLLQEASTFIEFEPGDVLLLGCTPDAPLMQPGDQVQVRSALLAGAQHHWQMAA
jgi:5-oxopent-3-ene-1,2,5-tricarboxylate decarboxylase / 2-hydroxyhepta-2,4-diene-1,7-dioate isomerase